MSLILLFKIPYCKKPYEYTQPHITRGSLSEPQAMHSSSSQLCSWCVFRRLMGLMTNFTAVEFRLMAYECLIVFNFFFKPCDISGVNTPLHVSPPCSASGWWSSLWYWWRLRKTGRTSRQKTRIRTLPTRKPTFETSACCCFNSQTGTILHKKM